MHTQSANSKCKFCTLESDLPVIRPISENAEKPLTFFREHINRKILPFDIISRISRHVLQKLGFTEEGLLRESLYKNGQYHDLMILSVLESEYRRTKQEHEG